MIYNLCSCCTANEWQLLNLNTQTHVTVHYTVLGIGGLGKTTLAAESYKKLKSYYDCGAFVSVGQNPDLAKVFKDILFHLDKDKYENIHNTGRGVDLLICEVRDFLQNKSLLFYLNFILVQKKKTFYMHVTVSSISLSHD